MDIDSSEKEFSDRDRDNRWGNGGGVDEAFDGDEFDVEEFDDCGRKKK